MVKAEDTVKFLANAPLFQGLNNRQLKQIASRFVPRTYQAGEAIVKQGQSGFGMFTIIRGRVEAVLELVDGSQTVVNEFGPTDFFGEISVLDSGPRTASIIAREETECLFLGHVEFISILQQDAEMTTEIAIALAKRLRQAVRKI